MDVDQLSTRKIIRCRSKYKYICMFEFESWLHTDCSFIRIVQALDGCFQLHADTDKYISMNGSKIIIV
jgi:hypothetical protein